MLALLCAGMLVTIEGKQAGKTTRRLAQAEYVLVEDEVKNGTLGAVTGAVSHEDNTQLPGMEGQGIIPYITSVLGARGKKKRDIVATAATSCTSDADCPLSFKAPNAWLLANPLTYTWGTIPLQCSLGWANQCPCQPQGCGQSVSGVRSCYTSVLPDGTYCNVLYWDNANPNQLNLGRQGTCTAGYCNNLKKVWGSKL